MEYILKFQFQSAFNYLQEMNIGSKVYLKNIEQIDDDSHIKVWVVKVWNFIKNNVVLLIEMIIIVTLPQNMKVKF